MPNSAGVWYESPKVKGIVSFAFSYHRISPYGTLALRVAKLLLQIVSPLIKVKSGGVLMTAVTGMRVDAIQFPENNHNRLGVIVTKGITVEKAIKTANTVLEQMEIIIQ